MFKSVPFSIAHTQSVAYSVRMMKTAMTHKEMTKHIRSRLAAAGIKARCSLYTSCGSKWIRISPPSADAFFTDDQSREINIIGKVNGLTLVRGMEIDIEVVNQTGEHFVMP